MTNCLEPASTKEVRNAAEKRGVGGGMDGDVKIFRAVASLAPTRRQAGATLAPKVLGVNGGATMAPLWRQAGAACIVLRQKGNIWRHLGAKLAPRPVRPHPWAVLRGFRRISELGNGPAIAFDGHLPRVEEGVKPPVFDPDRRV